MYRLILFVLTIIIVSLPAERIVYLKTEHPVVTYSNPKYFSHANGTSRRYSRSDPFYYVNIHYTTLIFFDNNITVDFYFYEFLSNVYKRSFVEMHFGFCDLVKKDKFFGSAMHQGKLLAPCPYPPGDYHLYNMTVPVQRVPHNFPFKKGRIYANFTLKPTNELILSAEIDMEIKTMNIRNKSAN